MADGLGFTIVEMRTGGAPDRKRPLYREPPSSPVFPIAALGALQLPAEALAEVTQAPMAVCGQSVLAAATLAVQAHCDVQLPGGAGCRPLTGLFVSVLESGERKSTVDRIALKAAGLVEEGYREAYRGEMEAYANAKEAWDAARAHEKKKAKGDKSTMVAAFARIGPEPRPPASPMLLVADPTPEALTMHLAARPWGGLFTAEGGQFIGGAAMNDETRLRTGALLNTLWDGDPIRRLRIGTGVTFLPGRRCSAHVMLQPVIASSLFADPTLDGIGTLARVLLVAPKGTAGTRLFAYSTPVAERALSDYTGRLAAIMSTGPTTMPNDPTILTPRVMTLDGEAEALWIAFYNAAETAQAPGGKLVAIKPFASKMAEHAGRLAAVLTVYADPHATTIGAVAMAGGTALANHYAAELLRLVGVSNIADELKLAQLVLDWLKARESKHCHLADIYQRGPNRVRDAGTARRIMVVLVEHGHAIALPAGTEVDGAPRREGWELVP